MKPENAGQDQPTSETSNGHGKPRPEPITATTAPSRPKQEGGDGTIWVVSQRSAATIRARFYKSIFLLAALAIELSISSDLLHQYGPVSFGAFLLSGGVIAAIAASEIGGLLSAVDMSFGRLKECLFSGEKEPETGQKA